MLGNENEINFLVWNLSLVRIIITNMLLSGICQLIGVNFFKKVYKLLAKVPNRQLIINCIKKAVQCLQC